MKIFLSAVSGQFKFCRDALASDLRAVGCEVKVQEDFQQGSGSLIAQIESYVAQCDRVIAIVGNAYGADASSDAVPSSNPQRSYTQWEYFFAIGERLRGPTAAAKDLYVYFASENYFDDHPVEQSEDEKARQQSFVDLIKKSGKHRTNFDNLDQLRRLVLRDGWHMSERPNIPRPPFQLPKRALARKFFGRQALLTELETRLRNREDTDIWGPAGMGKTALAGEALFKILGNDSANLAASPYRCGIVFLDLYSLKLESVDNACNHLVNAFDASTPQNMPTKDRARLACNGRRALVIIEGAEEAKDGASLQELLSVLSPETVRLVLTRNKNQTRTAKPLNVEAQLEQDDALDLIREIWQECRDESIVSKLYERFGGHPLALTWAASQLNAREESPQAFMQALSAATLPRITEPGYETHTLLWLFTRSTKYLSNAAKRVLSAAGMLAQLPFPMSMATAVLVDEGVARKALKQLVSQSLLRLISTTDEKWEFTHALIHQFANAATEPTLLAPLGEWATSAFEQAVEIAKISGDFEPLELALGHGSTLLSADHQAEFLGAFAENLRMAGDDKLRALGRLDLAWTANAADCAWLLSAPNKKLVNPRWQQQLLVSYDNLGDVALAVGDIECASKAFEETFLICKGLIEAYPIDSNWFAHLSTSYEKLGDTAAAAGKFEDARNAFNESAAIREQLAQADPDYTLGQQILSGIYNKLGHIYRIADDLDGASSAYQKALEISKRLAQFNPVNLMGQRDLATSYSGLGDFEEATGNTEGAHEAYKNGLAIVERLAKEDPHDRQLQRDLLMSLYKFGDIIAQQGRQPEALAYLQKSLAICKELTTLDPSNAIWRDDLLLVKERIDDLNK